MASYKTQTSPYGFWGGMVADKKTTKACDGIIVREPGSKHVVVCHFFGPFTELVNGYNAIQKWMKGHNKTSDGTSIEQYISDPTTVKPSEIQTDIIWPIK